MKLFTLNNNYSSNYSLAEGRPGSPLKNYWRLWTELYVPDWCHKESLCAAAAGQGEPEWAPEDWWALQTTVAGTPPPPDQADTRHLLPESEVHRHLAGAPSAAQPGNGHQQES